MRAHAYGRAGSVGRLRAGARARERERMARGTRDEGVRSVGGQQAMTRRAMPSARADCVRSEPSKAGYCGGGRCGTFGALDARHLIAGCTGRGHTVGSHARSREEGGTPGCAYTAIGEV